MKSTPYLISFPKIGSPMEGYLSIGQSQAHVPFDIKRVFWTYYTPDSVTRGRHTHYETEMVLVALSGIIIVKTEDRFGNKQEFTLKNPSEGLFLPPLTWHEMEYSHTAVQLVITSTGYDEKDYIRSYDEFKKLQK